MLEPEYRADSNSAARKGMWVRLPPAAPFIAPDFRCNASPPDATLCADVPGLGLDYVYLLGMYLGDGNLSPGRRHVWKLRITLDARYPGIIDRCAAVIQRVRCRPAGRVDRGGWIELYSYWKHWWCLFPQHGEGVKHRRAIRMRDWQWRLIEAFPEAIVAGLLQSDGCRTINTVKGRHYPRYFFSNRSDDIRRLFIDACALVGVECRHNGPHSVSVAKRASVERLDQMVAAKD